MLFPYWDGEPIVLLDPETDQEIGPESAMSIVSLVKSVGSPCRKDALFGPESVYFTPVATSYF